MTWKIKIHFLCATPTACLILGNPVRARYSDNTRNRYSYKLYAIFFFFRISPFGLTISKGNEQKCLGAFKMPLYAFD